MSSQKKDKLAAGNRRSFRSSSAKKGGAQGKNVCYVLRSIGLVSASIPPPFPPDVVIAFVLQRRDSPGVGCGGDSGGEQERMEAESADTIVGINAPVDLAGRTPLAWSVRSRARNKQANIYWRSVMRRARSNEEN